MLMAGLTSGHMCQLGTPKFSLERPADAEHQQHLQLHSCVSMRRDRKDEIEMSPSFQSASALELKMSWLGTAEAATKKHHSK